MSSKASRKNQAQVEVKNLAPSPDEVGIETEVKGESVVIQPEVEVKTKTKTKDRVEVTPEMIKALIDKHGNKSNAIRALAAEGKTRSETANLLGIRYQHVNNVLGQVLKREIKKERDAANGTTTTEATTAS
jgi:predicted RNA-binding protein YlqC (UPF0109 family)